MSDELKACPFCGTLVVAHEHDGIYNWVECQNIECQATTKVNMIIGRIEAAESIGTKQWNTRPIEDTLRAEVERLTRELAEANARADAAEYLLSEGAEHDPADFQP